MLDIDPPLRAWTRAKACRLIAETQREHGEVVAVRITGGDRWWELDDIMRQACGHSGNVLFVRAQGWVWITHECLDAVVTALARVHALARLRARQLPIAVECEHPMCGRRARNSPKKSPPLG